MPGLATCPSATGKHRKGRAERQWDGHPGARFGIAACEVQRMGNSKCAWEGHEERKCTSVPCTRHEVCVCAFSVSASQPSMPLSATTYSTSIALGWSQRTTNVIRFTLNANKTFQSQLPPDQEQTCKFLKVVPSFSSMNAKAPAP